MRSTLLQESRIVLKIKKKVEDISKWFSAVLNWTVKSQTSEVEKLITFIFQKSKSLGTDFASKEKIII